MGEIAHLGDQAVFLEEIQIKIQRFQATMMVKVLLFRKPHYILWSPFKHACNCEILFFLDLSQNYRCLLHLQIKNMYAHVMPKLWLSWSIDWMQDLSCFLSLLRDDEFHVAAGRGSLPKLSTTLIPFSWKKIFLVAGSLWLG